MSAILLLAFVFILTSCHWDGAALTGTGQAHSDHSQEFGNGHGVESPSQPAIHNEPACPMEMAPTGAVYIDADSLSGMLSIDSHNDRLLVKLSKSSGLLPTLAVVRYQARPARQGGAQILRTLACKEVTMTGLTGEHDYECVVPKAGNDDDAQTFYMESVELHIDGYAQNFAFHEGLSHVQSYGCTDWGTDVMMGTLSLPTLTPTDPPSH